MAALPCKHAHHTICLQQHMRGAGVTSVDDVECPVCAKLTAPKPKRARMETPDIAPTQVDAATPLPASPLATTQGSEMPEHASPRPMLHSAHFGFAFQDANREQPEAWQVDPIKDLKQELMQCQSADAYEKLLHPPELFKDLTSEKAVHDTVTSWLDHLLNKQASHGDAAAQEYSLRLYCPAPFRKALSCISSHHGWPKEALLQGLLVNVAWMEHHGTRLVDYYQAEHKRACTIAAFLGATPSLRKSSMRKFFSNTLLSAHGLAPELRHTCSDATVKGIKKSLETVCRAGYDCDEISMCYPTSLSSGDAGKGLHHANKTMILAWVNGEENTTGTGNGTTNLDSYAFRHYVLGQWEAVEQILATRKDESTYGFPKRFHLVWTTDLDSDQRQDCEASVAFLHELHQYLGQAAFPVQQQRYPDGFAKSMYRAVLQATKDVKLVNIPSHHVLPLFSISAETRSLNSPGSLSM